MGYYKSLVAGLSAGAIIACIGGQSLEAKVKSAFEPDILPSFNHPVSYLRRENAERLLNLGRLEIEKGMSFNALPKISESLRVLQQYRNPNGDVQYAQANISLGYLNLLSAVNSENQDAKAKFFRACVEHVSASISEHNLILRNSPFSLSEEYILDFRIGSNVLLADSYFGLNDPRNGIKHMVMLTKFNPTELNANLIVRMVSEMTNPEDVKYAISRISLFLGNQMAYDIIRRIELQVLIQGKK